MAKKQNLKHAWVWFAVPFAAGAAAFVYLLRQKGTGGTTPALSVDGSPPTASTVAPTSPGGGLGPGQYVVRSGDTLTKIARAAGVSLSALEAANPQITNPNRISPGQVVIIPGGGAGATSSALSLRQGRGYVTWMQQTLNALMGSSLAVNGTFGPLERTTLMRYQTKRGLRADGVPGPKTEAAMMADGASAPPLGQ